MYNKVPLSSIKVFSDPDQNIIFKLHMSVDKVGSTKAEKNMQRDIWRQRAETYP